MSERAYVVLDTETTGTDPDEDVILEIAWDVLDGELNSVLDEPRSYILDQRDWTTTFARLRENDFVRKMHHESGLLGDLLGVMPTQAWRVANTLASDLSLARSGRPAETTIHLTGFSVDFDREFLRAHPEFVGLFPHEDKPGDFHHKLYDLSAVKLAWEQAGIPLPKFTNSTPHRALNDVGETVEAARYFRHELIAAERVLS